MAVLQLPALNPCVSCGACCIEGGEVLVLADDPTPWHLTYLPSETAGCVPPGADEYRFMARNVDGCCQALDGFGGEDCSCSIYERRPTVCRQFEVEGEECLRARAAFGLPPL